ncbi:hypothetical protein BO78DRAFT_178070 [Aspergillus sclerotiicarbonarius CBS 121057]|uniref:Uncharacterized protein n=1 Tax=Aspergillus sclerotiicarbonarius (strain CBS 121057 / IBT 28362) TaxID=1448318 RepID=A0A319E293_ASPSB|nr:hypothetical protein BO78DRAFT_178070 [Aspergillus sclerotiicarbonarius CBS 121057]
MEMLLTAVALCSLSVLCLFVCGLCFPFPPIFSLVFSFSFFFFTGLLFSFSEISFLLAGYLPTHPTPPFLFFFFFSFSFSASPYQITNLNPVLHSQFLGLICQCVISPILYTIHRLLPLAP